MSPIEKKIKDKIESAGTPLRDWDIQINFGIKTGFNEAFIISGSKKDELIAEDPRSAEIIRPILRGRDIQKYSYDFADLWLINTHNGIKEKDIPPVDINQYPAVKAHLDNYYPQIANRYDKGDTPYNLRNCVYMEDFSKQKIIWKRIGSILRFSYDESGAFSLDSTCFASGEGIKFLVAILNSKMGNYLFKDSPKTGTGDLLISVQAMEPIRVPRISFSEQKPFIEILDKIIEFQIDNIQYDELEALLDDRIFDLYDLSREERQYIINHH